MHQPRRTTDPTPTFASASQPKRPAERQMFSTAVSELSTRARNLATGSPDPTSDCSEPARKASAECSNAWSGRLANARLQGFETVHADVLEAVRPQSVRSLYEWNMLAIQERLQVHTAPQTSLTHEWINVVDA